LNYFFVSSLNAFYVVLWATKITKQMKIMQLEKYIYVIPSKGVELIKWSKMIKKFWSFLIIFDHFWSILIIWLVPHPWFQGNFSFRSTITKLMMILISCIAMRQETMRVKAGRKLFYYFPLPYWHTYKHTECETYLQRTKCKWTWKGVSIS